MRDTGLSDGLLDVVVLHRHIQGHKESSSMQICRLARQKRCKTPACPVLAIELLQAKGESEGPPSWEMQLEIGRE
jgi:hypothetical protein